MKEETNQKCLMIFAVFSKFTTYQNISISKLSFWFFRKGFDFVLKFQAIVLFRFKSLFMYLEKLSFLQISGWKFYLFLVNKIFYFSKFILFQV